ncbi:MAG TPA: hypothetical protein ENK06_08000 [Gammaproteobacteria bacterium]|nr:hypothetical protein [Gammaproteobacteria bacterium]
MRNLYWYAMVLALLMGTSCAESEQQIPLPPIITSKTLDATHAVTLETKAVELVFIPNEVAPWLGRIVYTSTGGSAISMDIENRNISMFKLGVTKSLLGLSFHKQPGVFLSLNQNNQVESLLESGDHGQFVTIISSGAPVHAVSFCQVAKAQGKDIYVLEAKSRIQKYSVALSVQPDAKNLSRLTFTKDDGFDLKAPENTVACYVDKGHLYSLQSKDKRTGLSSYSTQSNTWQTSTLKYPSLDLVPVKLGQDMYFAFSTQGYLGLFRTDRPEDVEFYSITDGLSIKGMDKVSKVYATANKFGGTAFNQGVMALLNDDAKRIVYISTSYIADQVQINSENN